MTVGAVNPFKPAASVTIAASTTTADAGFPLTGDAILVTNTTSAIAFVRVGHGSQTASAADYPLPPNSRSLIAAGPYVTHIAAVLESGTGDILATVGDGTQY